MRIEILRNSSELKSLESAWEELRARHGQLNPYLAFAWQEATWRHYFSDNGDLAVAVASDATGVRGILPLVRGRRPGPFPVRQLQFLAHPILAMTGLGALGDKEAKSRLWAEALGQIAKVQPFDELILTGLWRDVSGIGPAGSANALTSWRTSPIDVNPVFDLPADWDECFASFSANKRKELRRRERDLAKVGEVNLEIAKSPEEVARLFASLVRLNTERFALAGIAGGLADAKFAGFHAEVAPRLAAAGQVRLFMLTVAGEPIATLYILSDPKSYRAYLGGHAAAFDKFGPGTLIDSYMIRHAITVDKVETVDFGPGDQPYKRRFDPRLEPLLECRSTRATPFGLALATRRAFRAKAKAPEAAACPVP